MVKVMKKMNEYTRKHIYVEEIATIFRKKDSIAYSIYKDGYGQYYIDAYDGADSIAEFNGVFQNDAEAIIAAQKWLDGEV